MMLKNPCFCQSKKNYETCCHPFLTGALKPSFPRQLMRSRYSAFCTKNIEYLVATRHPSKMQHNERDALIQSVNDTTWLGLKIIRVDDPKENQTEAFVEFAAFYNSFGKVGQLHENSRFVFEKEQWFYMDGQILDPLKLSRNTPCFCGSNKKFKKCHGR